MKQETVEIDGKAYTVKELKFSDLAGETNPDPKAITKRLMLLSTGLSEEEYEALSMKEGMTLLLAVNRINGLDDSNFQQQSKSD